MYTNAEDDSLDSAAVYTHYQQGCSPKSGVWLNPRRTRINQ